MYLIKAGSLTIYDSRDKVTYPVTKPVFGGELNAAGTLSFTIFPGHPHYNSLKKMQTFITAYRDDEEIFYGRILTTDKGLDGRMEVTCEGGLTFFLDSEIAKQESTETIDSFLRKCITSHNSQVEAAKQFTVGTIAPESQYASGSYPFDVTSYTVTKNALESLVLNRFGGFLRIRPGTNGIHYIDYITDYGRANSQQIKIGVNIEDKNDHVSGENIFTVLRPIAHASGSEADITIASLSQSDITIPNVTKNGDTLELTDKIAIYGKIVHTEDFSDPTTPIEVLRKAEAYITRHGTQLQSSVDISFVDFYHLNKNIPVVKLGDTFTNIEGFEGQTMTVAEISIDMENPANDTMTLKNAEEMNANRTDSFGNRNGSGGGSSSSMSSKMSSKNSQDAFRYKYIHENEDQLILATKNIEINASEKFSSLSNKIFLTVEDKEGSPGELVLKATKGNDKVDGAEVILTFDNVILHKGSSKMDLDGYTTDAELKVEKDRITAEVTRATTAEGQMSSRITQTADAITAEVTRATDAEGNLSSRITINAEGISTKVEKNGVISAINQTAESVTINANKINLEGYVTATQFEAEQARLTDLMAGNASASRLVASSGNFSNLEVTNSLTYYSTNVGNVVASVGPASASGGQITIPWTKLDGTSGTAVTFNIADTQFYRDGVAAARPHSLSGITLGSSDTGSSVSKTVTVFCNDDEEYDLSTTVNASAVYGAGTAYGKTLMGVEADTTNKRVKVVEGGTAHVLIYALAGISYDSSTHKYTATGTAKAGSATMDTASAASGTEAFDAGETAGYNNGYADGVNDGYATGAASVTVASVVKYQADSYDTDTHNYTVYVRGTASNGKTRDNSLTVNGASAYNAGASSVSVSAGSITVTG